MNKLTDIEMLLVAFLFFLTLLIAVPLAYFVWVECRESHSFLYCASVL